MADKREQILARLLTLAQGVSGIVLAVRNPTSVTDITSRPAIALLDGAESDDNVADERERKSHHSGRAPTLIRMRPSVSILLGSTVAMIGTEMNTYRARVVYAFTHDATLEALLGTNGRIRYRGCATGTESGRSIEGEMGLIFDIYYPFKPGDLAGI